jgi:hypothetical protein
MYDMTTSTTFCPHCSVEISAEVAACPHCQAAVGETTAVSEPKRDSLYKYLDKKWIMLAMLFCVTAGLGLPFLWKSRAFGTVGKTVLTVIMVFYTSLILWLIYLLLAFIGGRLAEFYRTW